MTADCPIVRLTLPDLTLSSSITVKLRCPSQDSPCFMILSHYPARAGGRLMNPALKTFTRVSLVALALAGAYVLTVTWRVSVAEQSLFGQSHLVPLSLKKPQFTEY